MIVTIKHKKVVEMWIDKGCWGNCHSGKSMSTRAGAVYSYDKVIARRQDIIKDGIWKPIVFVLRDGPTMSTNRHINLLKRCLTEKGVPWFDTVDGAMGDVKQTSQSYEGHAWLSYSKSLTARTRGEEYIQEALRNVKKAEEIREIYGVDLKTTDALKDLIEKERARPAPNNQHNL
jgi:hypothetical protein